MQLIRQKTIALLKPMGKIEQNLAIDTDLGGPFLYCTMLGFCLILVRLFVVNCVGNEVF
jgi:hypothetical protein